MKKIITTLPLLTCLIHGQMRPPLALSSKEKRGCFPRLKVRMDQLVKDAGLEEIDSWYMETLPMYTQLHVSEEAPIAEDLRKAFIEQDGENYTPTTVAEHMPIMDIELEVRNTFSDLFYDIAMRLETKRTYLWLIAMEKKLHNDEDMLQVVREILVQLNEYSKECINRYRQSKENSNEIIRLRIMQLYFVIEKTFCQRPLWRGYLENTVNLPLTLDEYCYSLWEGTPEESWRTAYENALKNIPKTGTPDLTQLTDKPKLTTAAEKFTTIVAPFRFEELPLVKCLTPKQQAELIELMVKDALYASAMLKYLGYYDRLRDVYQLNTNEKIIGHCAKALGCSSSNFKKYFYSLRSTKSRSTYERHNAKILLDKGQIEEDYNRIKESK
jgi:hypothetical protein